MIEAVIALAVVCAIQAIVLASLPFLLWQFISKEQRLREVERDVAQLDEQLVVINQAMGMREER